MTEILSLQETFSPEGGCFGCGPTNERGLRVRSFPKGDSVVATWTPEPHHRAFLGVLNGGICGALLDCHSNWAAAWHLKQKRGDEALPSTVTAEFAVKLKRPTSLDHPVELHAQVVESTDDRAVVEATLSSEGRVTATCRGVFVAVPEGHPAFGRW